MNETFPSMAYRFLGQAAPSHLAKFSILLVLILAAPFLNAQEAASPLVKLTFPRAPGHPDYQAYGIAIDDQGTIATVYSFGLAPEAAKWQSPDGQQIGLKLIAHDPVSRLTLLQLPPAHLNAAPPLQLGSSLKLSPGDPLALLETNNHRQNCTFVGSEKVFDGNVLPLSLLRFNYANNSAKPGEPILDSDGKIAAIALYGRLENEKTGYALPVEVIKHVRDSPPTKGKILRCWLGLILDADFTIPSIVGLRPNSPASRAGIKKFDIILAIDQRPILDYADCVNAFYYLQPNTPSKVTVLRGTEKHTLEVIPEVLPTALVDDASPN